MSSAKIPFHGSSGGSPPPPPPPSPEDEDGNPGRSAAFSGLWHTCGVVGTIHPPSPWELLGVVMTKAAMLKDTWAEFKTTKTEEEPPKETSLLGCTNDRRQKNLLGYVYVWCICVGGWGGVENTWRARSNTSNFIAMLSTSACKNKKLSYVNRGEGEKVL